MKNIRPGRFVHHALAALALTCASLSYAQMPITNIIQTFDADDSSGNKWGHEWGPGTQAWDGAQGNPVGALLVTVTFSASSDTPCTTYICNNGNPWWNGGTTFKFSDYDYLEFDIKWDDTSDISISQFNDVSTIPTTATNQAGATILNALLNAGAIGGLEINLCGGPGGQMAPVIASPNIPAAAATGWTHMKIPINKTQANIDGVTGIVFHKWVNQYSGQIANDFQGRFWVDNVILTGTTAPPPPPTISVPTPAKAGLNVFANTSGLYDRQAAVLRQTSGLSWVGSATPANPVTYSFSIAGYPNSQNCEAWLFLAPNPNPSYVESAPDWNQTNCAIVYIQGSTTSATAHFRYKVGEPNQQAMYSGGSETRTTSTTTNNYYYNAAPGSLPGGAIVSMVSPGVYNITNESGDLADISSSTVLGTWKLKFTSDTDATLITPDGTSTNVVIPVYNVGNFAEQAAPGFRIYLGMQANNADAMNQAVVYSDFAVSGNSSPYSEDFLTDSVLDTTNVWNTGSSPGPQGVLVVPSGSASWIKWTLPDAGFSVQASPTLLNPLAWTDPTGPKIPLNGFRAQLLASSDIPVGNTAFFRMIKREATQLQVLFPGETNAPNTPSGKAGTPDPVSLGASGGLVNVTINSVDSTFHIVGTSDTVHITTTDGTGITPADAPLVGGTLTQMVQFGSTGAFTVTASDVSNTNILSGTSSSVTVNP